MVQNSNDETFIIGKFSIIISEVGIIEKSNDRENKVNWNSIKKIVNTSTHFYIYYGLLNGFIIPFSAFQDEVSKNMFFEFVNKKINCK